MGLISIFVCSGLQYVIEVINDRTENEADKIYYICALCSMKLTTTTLLPHIKSVPHRLNFTVSSCDLE